MRSRFRLFLTAAVIATAEPAAAAAPRMAPATFLLVEVFDFFLDGEEAATVLACDAPDAGL
ncbi:MAG TPA: hypothetical protein VMS12_09680 [Thermoanaerobaculia bacterium]|nr:hypothetical protein [Thermoanaerobaculia bacterium]